MKQTIEYYNQNKQMGDLLISMGVSIRDDFSNKELNDLRMMLEEYMSGDSKSKITIDLKKFNLVIKGADEASCLYQYVK